MASKNKKNSEREKATVEQSKEIDPSRSQDLDSSTTFEPGTDAPTINGYGSPTPDAERPIEQPEGRDPSATPRGRI